MYYYLYDSFLSDNKYSTVLAKIENRLIDLGINGKIEKMSLLKNIREMIEDGIKNSAVDTVIAVGNDKTFAKVLAVTAYQNGITLGFIPIGTSAVAKTFGIPMEEKACDVLSARIIEKIDLGKVNNSYFFSTLTIPSTNQLTVECNDGCFKISSLRENNLVQILNMQCASISGEHKIKVRCNPKDGRLDAVFAPLKKNWGKERPDFGQMSVFPIKKLKIKSEESSALVVDGEMILKTPATIEIIPKKLKIIVGKNREF